jgi:transposase
MAKSDFTYPAWVLKYRTPGTELRHIGDRFYLYTYKTVYDPIKKRPKKVSSSYIGRITEAEGIIKKDKSLLEEKLIKKNTIRLGNIREFGVSNYIDKYFSDHLIQLRVLFGKKAELIFLIAYARLVFQSPIKRMPNHIANSWLCESLELRHFSDKTISDTMNWLGTQRHLISQYMKSFITEDDFILVDTTHMLSHSERIVLAHKGYNSKMDYEPQINLMYLFGQASKMPVYYRLHAGNIKEISALKLTILESELQNTTIIGDKGFYSKANMDMLDEAELNYILPLKRDSTLIEYESIKDNSIKLTKNYFKHEDRIIWYTEKTWDGNKKIYLFLDDYLKQKEEKDYLSRIESHPDDYSIAEYESRYFRLGTFAVISNLQEKSPPNVYVHYKGRMNIETMFDCLKNILKADTTYMQNENTLQGWMFLNHIALQWYQHIYLKIAEKNLTNNLSVKDLIALLQNHRKVNINNEWHDSEITKDLTKLLKKLEII